ATPGFPLPLRNALATLCCDALDADDAYAALAWLASPDLAPSRDAAGRAAAAHRRRGMRPDDPITRAVVQAVALWNERLFFEVHEVLEAVWQRETGDRRQALQGLIQVAVAYHHLAHGNPRGARTLLREGRVRLAATPSGTLPLVDVDRLLAATAPDETALATSGR